MQRWLNEWIMNYVDADPVNSRKKPKPVVRWLPQR